MARVAKPAPGGTRASVCPLLCAHDVSRRLFLHFVANKNNKILLFQGIFKTISRLIRHLFDRSLLNMNHFDIF